MPSCWGVGVWGLGFRVWGLGFRVWGLGFGFRGGKVEQQGGLGPAGGSGS